MRSATFLVKPASSRCNLRCRYCFYHAVARGRVEGDRGIMSAATLETLVERALELVDESCAFAFQGGEPTLAGLDFYRDLLAFQKKHNRKGVRVLNSIQTNGTLLDDEWAAFLSQNRFFTGLSLDGPRDINDLNRTRPDGSGTWAAAVRAAGLLQRHGAEFNVLAVVTDASARHARQVYRSMRRLGFAWLQFIPCLDPPGADGEAGGGTRTPGLSPGRYGRFLCDLFDVWHDELKSGTYVSIRLFDNLVRMLLGGPPEACDMNGFCSVNPVIESDGSVYPCDFFTQDAWLLGSILDRDIPLADMLSAGKAAGFVNSSRQLPPECRECRWLSLCRGGCARQRVDGKYRFCNDLTLFLDYAGDRLARLAATVPRAGDGHRAV